MEKLIPFKTRYSVITKSEYEKPTEKDINGRPVVSKGKRLSKAIKTLVMAETKKAAAEIVAKIYFGADTETDHVVLYRGNEDDPEMCIRFWDPAVCTPESPQFIEVSVW